MSRCYSCGLRSTGHSTQHKIGCPEAKKEFLIPTHYPKSLKVIKTGSEVAKDIDIGLYENIDMHTGKPKVGNTVIGIGNRKLLVTPGTTMGYTIQPIVACRLHHLWIADDCCDSFEIEDIRIASICLIPNGPVQASHFSMKYRDKYPPIDFGALGIPATCNPAQRIWILVRNHGLIMQSFQALFEVTTQ